MQVLRGLALLILGLPLATYGAVGAQLSGDCGDRCEVTGPGPWIADDTFIATQSRATPRDGRQFGVTIHDAAGGSWVGGFIDSELTDDDEWTFKKNIDGAGLRIRGGPFRVEGVRIVRSEDSLRFQGNTLADVDAAWITDAYDDAIEADNRPNRVRITRSYLENTHTLISVRRGGARRDGNPPPVLIEVADTVITMARTHLDSRAKRVFPWNVACDLDNGRRGHGQLIKTESVSGQPKGARDTLLFRNVTIAAWCLPKQSKSNTRLLKPGNVIHPDSAHITYVWLGPQTSAGNGGVAMVNVDGVMIPEQLGIHEYPDALFTVTDDPAALDAAVDTFFAEYWRQGTPPPPPPDDDPPQPLACEDDLAMARDEIALLEQLLDEAEQDRLQAQDERDAALALAQARRDAINAMLAVGQAAP